MIDPVGPPEWTWFRLTAPLASSATSSGEYWLYCDNPAAPLVDDQGSAVFDLYDPFDTIDTRPMDGQQQRLDVERPAGVRGTGDDNGVVTDSATVMADHHAVDFAPMLETDVANWWGGYQDGTGDVRPWSTWWQYYAGTANRAYVDIERGVEHLERQRLRAGPRTSTSTASRITIRRRCSGSTISSMTARRTRPLSLRRRAFRSGCGTTRTRAATTSASTGCGCASRRARRPTVSVGSAELQ